jgi:hypothetical protein
MIYWPIVDNVLTAPLLPDKYQQYTLMWDCEVFLTRLGLATERFHTAY